MTKPIPKKPVKVSKKKKTLPTEIDWGNGIPKDRLRYINAHEEALIKKNRKSKAKRSHKGVRAYADDSASSNGVERQPEAAYDGYNGDSSYDAGTTYSGNTLGRGDDYGGSMGGGSDSGGISSLGSGSTTTDSWSGGGIGGDGNTSISTAGAVTASNAAAPSYNGITNAAPSLGSGSGSLIKGSAESLFKQKEGDLKGGIGSLSDGLGGSIGSGKITAGNIVSTTAPNYASYQAPTFNGVNSVNALRDTMQVMSGDINANANPYTKNMNQTVRVLAGETNPGNIGAGQITNVMVNRGLVNKSDEEAKYKNSLFSKDQWSSIGNDRFKAAKPGSTLAGQVADQAINEMMNGVPSPNATDFRDSSSTMKLGIDVGGNTFGNFEGISNDTMADIRAAHGLATNKPPSMDASNPYNKEASLGPSTFTGDINKMASMPASSFSAASLESPTLSAPTTLKKPENYQYPGDIAPDLVPPGHWGREEEAYLTQIGAMNQINNDPYAKAGYNFMQRPDGSGLKISGNPEDGLYGKYSPGEATVYSRVDPQSPINSYADIVGGDQLGYADTLAHELGHVGSAVRAGAPWDSQGAVDMEEIRQRYTDYRNNPPGSPTHEDAKGYLTDIGFMAPDPVPTKGDFGGLPQEPTEKSDFLGDNFSLDTEKAMISGLKIPDRAPAAGVTLPDGTYKTLGQMQTEMEANGFAPTDIYNSLTQAQDYSRSLDQLNANGTTTAFKNDMTWQSGNFTDTAPDIEAPPDPTEMAQKFQSQVAAALDKFRNPDVAAKDAGIVANQDMLRGLETVMNADKPPLDASMMDPSDQRLPGGNTATSADGTYTINEPSEYGASFNNRPLNVTGAYQYGSPEYKTVDDEYNRLGGIYDLREDVPAESEAPSEYGLVDRYGTRITDEEWAKFAKPGTNFRYPENADGTPMTAEEWGDQNRAKADARHLGDKYKLSPEERERLVVTNLVEKAPTAFDGVPLDGFAVGLGKRLMGVEKTRDFLSRPSTEQDQLYAYAREMNDKYGRSNFPGEREGGADGPTLDSTSQQALTEAQWENGINIPSKGDPDYDAYVIWLKWHRPKRSGTGIWDT